MTSIVLDAIAADLATLTREVQTPVEPFGYGTDLSCVSDITPNLDEVDPFSPLGIAQALIRRLTTPRGMLPDDPFYGLDVRAFCNRGVTIAEMRSIATQVRLECTKDDRVGSAAVKVTATSNNSLTIQISIVAADPNSTTFSLTLAASSAAVILEAIG